MDKALLKYWLVLYKYDKDPLQRIYLLKKIVEQFLEQKEPLPAMLKDFIEKEKEKLTKTLQKTYQEKQQQWQQTLTENQEHMVIKHHHDPWENENDPFSD